MFPEKARSTRNSKKTFLVGILEVTNEKSRIRTRILSRIWSLMRMRKSSVRIQGSGAVPNVTDPEHWFVDHPCFSVVDCHTKIDDLCQLNNIMLCKCK
jgi:hypothetical protein